MKTLSSFFYRHPGVGRDPRPRRLKVRDKVRADLLGFVFLGPGFRRDDARDDHEDGFTLVELMVVIVIIGLLATIVAINVLPNLGKANTGKARTDIATLEQALEYYRLDNMSYPRTEQGLRSLVSAPSGLAQPGRYNSAGYIKKLPNDPWGKPYEYAMPGTHGGPFDILSLGADGQPGGEGENADIGSWQ